MSAKRQAKLEEEYENLAAFRADYNHTCENCGISPVVSAVGLCGPCTWGEADTADGSWWSKKDEDRFLALSAELGKAIE